MKNTQSRIFGALACIGAVSLPLSAGARSLTEFEDDQNKALAWNITNDGVMGGLSKGKASFTDRGTMVFSGMLSLKNNGGFSTVRTGSGSFDLGDYDGLIMRVKGDGRTYELRANSTARYRGMEVSFKADFPTTKGEWREVKVPFSELRGSWRGRDLPDEKFDASKVSRVGLLLADKKEGQFEIEVDWIRAYRSDSKTVSTAKRWSKPKTIVDLALADGRFKTLAAALTEAELVSVLKGEGPFTVFAPTDDAFAKLPKGTVESLLKPENRDKLKAVLTYHVSAGANKLDGLLKSGEVGTVQGEKVSAAFASGKVKINDAALIDANIAASNGVIHVIDSVLLPPERGPKNIVETAKAAGSFGTLLAAAEAAGLVSALSGKGPITVFAPTDEAFAKLPKGTVESLLKKENIGKLKSILTYHVVAGKVSAGDALNAGSAGTLNGQQLKFGFKDGRLQVNESNITAVDIECGNGVIHVIDQVLIPAEPKKRAVKAMSSLDLIYAAIAKGVPLYNGGDAAACAAVYKETLSALAEDDEIEEHVRRMIAGVIKHGSRAHDDARAWLYRRSLDGMVAYLEHRGR